MGLVMRLIRFYIKVIYVIQNHLFSTVCKKLILSPMY